MQAFLFGIQFLKTLRRALFIFAYILRVGAVIDSSAHIKLNADSATSRHVTEIDMKLTEMSLTLYISSKQPTEIFVDTFLLHCLK